MITSSPYFPFSRNVFCPMKTLLSFIEPGLIVVCKCEHSTATVRNMCRQVFRTIDSPKNPDTNINLTESHLLEIVELFKWLLCDNRFATNMRTLPPTYIIETCCTEKEAGWFCVKYRPMSAYAVCDG